MNMNKWTLVAAYGTIESPIETIVGYADNDAELLLGAHKAVEGHDDPWAMDAWNIIHRNRPIQNISLNSGIHKGFRIGGWDGGSVYAVLN